MLESKLLSSLFLWGDNMLIRVRFFGDMKNYLKKSQMTIEIPHGSTIREFIFELSENIDVNLLDKFVDADEVRSGIRILVNGRNISHLQGLETVLEDRDLVSILPVAGGG